MSEDIAHFIPEDVAVSLTMLSLKTGGSVAPAFIRDEATIAAKWRERCLGNPHLFNGKVFLQSALRLEDACLSGRAVELDYASFMHWRGNAPFQKEVGLTHVFPLAAIESSDGYLIAVRSAVTTVNSGLIYFAAGMFDEHDVVNRRLDHYGNMAREVREETGLDLGEMHSDGLLTAFRTGRFLAVFQCFVSAMNSDELVARIHDFIATQAVPEVDEVVLIARAADITDKMPGYMRAYCHWRLAN